MTVIIDYKLIFWILLMYNVRLSEAALGSCLSHTGEPVSWCLLYQQKQKPFMHYYVDSTNVQQVVHHFPEKADSVLSRVVSSLIENEDIEYMVYSSDLKNIRNIAEGLQIPMYSKFMHGIIASGTSWTSGFWILHNNLFFPLAKPGKWYIPGTEQWKLSTMGDSNADIFYICLTAGIKEDMNTMLRKVLAGNPYILHRRLYDNIVNDINMQAVASLNSTFGHMWSATLFMNCLYANENETSTNCLLTYSESTGTQVFVYTRPRGMIRHSKAFCYNSQSKSVNEFVDLQHTSTNNADWTNSMFTLTDVEESGLFGVTCFGQDIAANTETVAVMVCFRLPRLYKTLLKLSKISNWPCPKRKHSTEGKTIRPVTSQPGLSANTKTSADSLVPQTFVDNQKGFESLVDTNDPEEKPFVKFCHLVNCNIRDINSNTKEVQKTKSWISSFRKSDKIKNRLKDTVSDINLENKMMAPLKTNKMKTKQKIAIQLKTETDFERYIVANKNSVLGLFCRDGCTFCQKAKEEFVLLGGIDELQLPSLDIIMVEINNPNLPTSLITPWTPYIRYKPPGTDSGWVDYKGEDYTLMSILEFLELVSTSSRSEKQGSFSTENSAENDDITVLSSGRTKRSIVTSKSTGTKFNALHRRHKRNVIKDGFTLKHLWYVSADHFQRFREAKNSESQIQWVFLVSCTRLVRLAKYNIFRFSKRSLQDFIVIKQDKKQEVEKYLLDEAKSGKGIIHKDNRGNDRITFNVSLDAINADLLLVRIKYIYKPAKKSSDFEISNLTSICIKEKGEIALGGDGIQFTIDHFAAYYSSDQDNAPNNVCILPPNQLLKGVRGGTGTYDIDTYEPWCEQFNVTLSVTVVDTNNLAQRCFEIIWNIATTIYRGIDYFIRRIG